MLRLRRYLIPYIPMALLTIVLLFVQANADLALPDYMSRIVNNGIQQGGVENAAAEAVRISTMDKLLIFISPEDQAVVLDAYSLVDEDSAEYADYLERYPILADELIYVLNDIEQETLAQLNVIIGRSLMIVSGIEQFIADPSKAAEAGIGMDMGFDLTQIPPGMDIFQMLSQLPAAQLTMITGRFDETIDVLGESMVNQMAVGAVKVEYEALGMDTEKLQSEYIIRVGGQMLLISLVGGLSTIATVFLAAEVAAGVARDVRRDVFKKVESFSSAEFNKFSTASLITRSTNDVTQLQMVTFMILRMVFYAPILGVGGIIRAIDKSASMWWIIAVGGDGIADLHPDRFCAGAAKIQDRAEFDRPAQPGHP